ncbi:MAG TPA: T9SS type A sorting domain-containing protein [Bacteroides sp.]|nr:T9SS type A sorting domain-containing protein [Bacteroides sp.]
MIIPGMKRIRITCMMALPVMLFLLSAASSGQTSTYKLLVDMGTRYDYAYSVAVQHDNKVIVGGDAWGNPCLIRFDTTGAPDYSFGSSGKVFTSWNCASNPADNDIKVQEDGKIVLGTRYDNGTDENFVVARFHTDGTADSTFSGNGKVITRIGDYSDLCNCIAIQPDGKILAGGCTGVDTASKWMYDFAVVRYHPDGTIDTEFGENGSVSTHIGNQYSIGYSMAIQPDGKIILAGETRDSIFSDVAIARYHPDGSPDHSFGTAGIVRTTLSETDDFARSVALQSDGKIVVAGSTQQDLSNYDIALLRYLPDGSLDNTFGVNGIVKTDVGIEFGSSVVVQPDQKIIVAGGLTTTTIYDFAILRYHTDGILDNSFGNNGLMSISFGGGDSEGQSVALGNDGEIIIAGSYNHGAPNYFDFALVRLFSRLNPSASPLLSFPENGAAGQQVSPELVWSPVQGNASYHIQISGVPDFTTLAFEANGITATSCTAEGLDYNTTYYWRVCATVNGITGNWSDTWSFTTIDETGMAIDNETQIRLYPLPAADILFIGGIENEHSIVELLSADGKMIRQTEGFGIKYIHLRGIPGGMYILRVTSSGTDLIKKIMKLE